MVPKATDQGEADATYALGQLYWRYERRGTGKIVAPDCDYKKNGSKNLLGRVQKKEEEEMMKISLSDNSMPEGVKLTEDGNIEGVEPMMEEAQELPGYEE